MSRLLRVLLRGNAIGVFLFVFAPIIVLVPVAFSSVSYLVFPPPGYSTRWFESILSDTVWVSSFLHSLKVGLVATIVTIALGLPSAVALVRGSYHGKSVIYFFIASPLIVPTVITAISVYLFLAPFDVVGSALVTGLAHAVICLPVFVVLVSARLQGIDERLEKAAVSLGSSPVGAFVAVTLPAIRPAVLSGSVLAFLTSFDELITALLLAGPGAQTLQVQIWNTMLYSVDPSVAAVGVLLVSALTAGGVVVLARHVLVGQRGRSSTG